MDHELGIFEGNHFTQCMICNTTGLLLCCDYCPNVYHPSCLNPSLNERPREYWQCPQCVEDCQNQNIQAIIDRREQYNNLHPTPFPSSSFLPPDTMDPRLHIPFIPSRPRPRSCRQKEATKTRQTSLYRGVYYRGNKWNAQIQVNGKKRYLGTFDSEWKAAKCYDHAAIELHGDRARLNFPNEVSILSPPGYPLPEGKRTHPRKKGSSMRAVNPSQVTASSTLQSDSPSMNMSTPKDSPLVSPVARVATQDETEPLSQSPLDLQYPSSPLVFRPLFFRSMTIFVPEEEAELEIRSNRQYIQLWKRF